MPGKAIKTTGVIDKQAAKKTPKSKSKKIYGVMAKNQTPGYVFKVAEARENFSSIVTSVGSDNAPNAVVGSRGKPEIMCISYERYKPLLGHGNRTEKLALLIVEELLPDAPQHIRRPALEELSLLPMGDLECLWQVKAFPLAAKEMTMLKRCMKNPIALDRLAQRADVSEILQKAQAAGLYDALGDDMSQVLDEADR